VLFLLNICIYFLEEESTMAAKAKGYVEHVGVKKKTSIGGKKRSLSLSMMNKNKRRSFKLKKSQGK